jgi:hypothetical protein
LQITRGNLNGTQQEPLPILTVAKELNIDAIQAYIYWSTGHAVECARLNGKNRRTYYPAELFSGKQGGYNPVTSWWPFTLIVWVQGIKTPELKGC